MRDLLWFKDTKKAETYVYIYLFYNCYNMPPSYGEIAKHFGITMKTAFSRVMELEQLGHVYVPYHTQRGIRLTALDCDKAA